MEFIIAKTILTKVKYGSDWYGVDYNMNLYRGCCHGCIYCDSRSSCYQIENFDTVRGKKDALLLLERELRNKRQKGVVGIGSMSDTYNPFEKEYEITRKALFLLKRYGFGVSIDTKSDLVLRDLDILRKLNENQDVIVKLTVTTAEDELSRIIEPGVCVSSRRLQAVKELNENGIYAGIMMNPVLPFLTDSEENIRSLVQLAYENKAKFISTYMGMTLRENQREYYYQKLDRLFPGLKEKYISLYGNSYQCQAPRARRLYEIFEEECRKYGILYRMKDIIAGYQKRKDTVRQMSIFDWMDSPK